MCTAMKLPCYQRTRLKLLCWPHLLTLQEFFHSWTIKVIFSHLRHVYMPNTCFKRKDYKSFPSSHYHSAVNERSWRKHPILILETFVFVSPGSRALEICGSFMSAGPWPALGRGSSFEAFHLAVLWHLLQTEWILPSDFLPSQGSNTLHVPLEAAKHQPGMVFDYFYSPCLFFLSTPHVSICHLLITNISSQFKPDSPNLYPNCLRVNRILGETLGGLSLGPSSRASSFPCASAQKRASQEHPEIAAVTSNHWSPGVSTLVGNFLPFCHVLQGEGDTLQLDGNSVALNERLVLNRKLHLAKGSYSTRWHQPS